MAVIPDTLQVAEEVDEIHALLRIAQAVIQALDVIFSVLPLLIVDLVLKVLDDAIRLSDVLAFNGREGRSEGQIGRVQHTVELRQGGVRQAAV